MACTSKDIKKKNNNKKTRIIKQIKSKAKTSKRKYIQNNNTKIVAKKPSLFKQKIRNKINNIF